MDPSREQSVVEDREELSVLGVTSRFLKRPTLRASAGVNSATMRDLVTLNDPMEIRAPKKVPVAQRQRQSTQTRHRCGFKSHQGHDNY